jgi:transcription factor SPN1
LIQLPIRTDNLRESGIGRVMFFYTKCPRIEPKVKRVADQLVAKWSRPILRRSADYREKRLQTKEYREDDRYGNLLYCVDGTALSMSILHLVYS